tara:strand:+ start:254 stop:442 length:189 start_codon:yes stop_codon:yes gene_type:complete
MIKEFKIDEILNAVNSIYNIGSKKNKNIKVNKKTINYKDDLTHKKLIKSEKVEVLVLDQMID